MCDDMLTLTIDQKASLPSVVLDTWSIFARGENSSLSKQVACLFYTKIILIAFYTCL